MFGAEINWLAVIVAAVVAFLVGGLWYSPLLFGNLWIRLYGYREDELEEMKKGANRAYVVSFVGYFVMAVAFSILLGRIGVVSVLTGIKLGALLFVGFVGVVGLTTAMFSQRPIRGWFLDAGYQLVYLLLMGIILAGWR